MRIKLVGVREGGGIPVGVRGHKVHPLPCSHTHPAIHRHRLSGGLRCITRAGCGNREVWEHTRIGGHPAVQALDGPSDPKRFPHNPLYSWWQHTVKEGGRSRVQPAKWVKRAQQMEVRVRGDQTACERGISPTGV